MEIRRNGSQASVKGPQDWFTGTVRIDPLFQALDGKIVDRMEPVSDAQYQDARNTI